MRTVLCLSFLLAACSPPPVTGNAVGGVLPWAFTNERMAFNAAQTHCQKYGRDARITQINPYAGGTVSFDCVRG